MEVSEAKELATNMFKQIKKEHPSAPPEHIVTAIVQHLKQYYNFTVLIPLYNVPMQALVYDEKNNEYVFVGV